jgi:UDP-N-acetylglucosamine 2-epimerase (non-hydrolysing)
MKVAPVMAALSAYPRFQQMLIHTGQHYDANMSDVFFNQLGIPEPDINLHVGSASHAVQTAEIMTRFEEVVQEHNPDLVLVYGDVNSTLAASLVCAKLLIPVGHVEAGLRSRDRTMPEEINRVLTDQCADYLFTPCKGSKANLTAEGIRESRIHFVGNVMIDTLVRLLPQAKRAESDDTSSRFALVTLHRPSNVDDPRMLREIMITLVDTSRRIPVVFPVHPRTRHRLSGLNLQIPADGQFSLYDPLGYLEFLDLQRRATLVITDSGGIQEETTYLGVPCLTVRENTERPVTVTVGTNILVGQDMNRLRMEVDKVLAGRAKKGAIPDLWDGKAGERIAERIAAF